MKLFYRNKGSISVFLTIILVPVLLLGGMTTDAVRICMSKVVISDAGEMAMNAGLAQYNEDLHDEYGLLVMNQSPEAMESELEKYFNGSLNGTGLTGEKEYNKILDLLTKNFDAINVQGSEIYQTEVEKQQILEYMKYRAPVCLAELVSKKLGELKDTKKMAESMKAEMEFGEAMEDCQNEFEKAKKALDTLDGVINNLKSQIIGEELSKTQKEYEDIVALALLMWAACQVYDDKLPESQSGDMKASVEQFLVVAKGVELSLPYESSTFNGYLSSLYYINTINSMGGIDKLLENSVEGQEETEEGEETVTGGYNSVELKELKTRYEKELERIKEYPDILLSRAKTCINNHYNILNGYWNSAKTAEQAAKTAYDRLEDVKKELEKAKKAFDSWEKANNELKDAGKNTESMDDDVKKYKDFFNSSNGTGKADYEQIDSLMSAVQENQNYFHKLTGVLEREKFWDESIATVPSDTQYERYKKEASACLSGLSVSEYETKTSLKNVIANRYIIHYEHKDISEAGVSQSISNHPFYKRIQEYCNESNKENSQKEQNETNERLEESKKAGEEANKADEYPEFGWGSIDGLPSAHIGKDASEAQDKLTDLNAAGDVNNSSARKETTKKFKESIEAATSFLDKVDQIATKGLENLYISEYAMQMFSYYTVNKKNGETRPEEDIVGISGYKLSKHAAYQAECEYILWGKNRSQTNIMNTAMMIFGIRLLFNSFFAFTDKKIGNIASSAAAVITGAAPYLQPVVKVVIILGFAGVETAKDISKIKQGYGVVIVKNSDSWASAPYMKDNTDSKNGMTFDYSEYLRVFLNISMLAGKEVGILGRIADCIQVNQPSTNLLEGYTMLSIQAEVSSRTTFMRKISDWNGSGAWGFPDDTYTISYQSILGY